MAERATIIQVSQLGVESTAAYGITVPATKRIQTVTITPGIKAKVDLFRPMGSKFATVQQYAKEWTECKLAGKPSYGELPYFLSSFIGSVTPTALGTNGAYTWTFSPADYGIDTHLSFTLEHGSAARANQVPGLVIPQLGLKFTHDAIDLSGSAFGLRLVDPFTLTALTAVNDVQTVTITGTATGGTFTLTINVPGQGVAAQTTAPIAYNASPAAVASALTALSSVGAGNVVGTGTSLPGGTVTLTFQGQLAGQNIPLMTHTDSLTGTVPAAAIAHTTPGVSIVPEPYAIKPLLPTQIDLYLDATSGALGSTQQTRGFAVDWNVGGYLKPLWPLQSSLTSFATFVEAESKPDVKLLLAADAQGLGTQLPNFRTGATVFARLKATGSSIDGTNTYLAQFDFAIKLRDVSEFKDQDGVYCVEYTGQVVHDPGWNKALNIILQNTLSAL